MTGQPGSATGRGSFDRWVMVLILMFQVMIVWRLWFPWTTGRQDADRNPSLVKEPVEYRAGLDPLHEKGDDGEGWSPEAWDMGVPGLMADAMGRAARLQSAVQFYRGWEALSASPSLDMRDQEGAYFVTFSIPGVRAGDLGVFLDGRVLTVRAHCQSSPEGGGRHLYERRVLLPGGVNASEPPRAILTNGVLKVRIPKGSEWDRSRRVMRLF